MVVASCPAFSDPQEPLQPDCDCYKTFDQDLRTGDLIASLSFSRSFPFYFAFQSSAFASVTLLNCALAASITGDDLVLFGLLSSPLPRSALCALLR